jgi:DNA repair protein RadC
MTHSFEDHNELFQVAEVQLKYSSKIPSKNRPKVASSADARELFKKVWDNDTIELFEEFKMLILNRANQVIGVVNLSKGGVAGTVVDPKLVFSYALKTCASALILCHNHPSGNLKPSNSDIQLTKKLETAGKLLEIDIHDHIIITSEGSYSMRDNGDI